MTRFRQALLDELMSRVTDPAERPAPAVRAPIPRRPRLAAGGVALAAVAVGAVVMSAQGPAAPAYAVTSNSDGTVSLTVNRIGDPATANRDLRATGTRAVIMLPSSEEDCPWEKRGRALSVTLAEAYRELATVTRSAEDSVVRIRPASIPADAVLIVVPREPGAQPEQWLSWFAAPGPTCVPSRMSAWRFGPVPGGSPGTGPAATPTTNPSPNR